MEFTTSSILLRKFRETLFALIRTLLLHIEIYYLQDVINQPYRQGGNQRLRGRVTDDNQRRENIMECGEEQLDASWHLEIYGIHFF